jgi:hypothetical protein
MLMEVLIVGQKQLTLGGKTVITIKELHSGMGTSK